MTQGRGMDHVSEQANLLQLHSRASLPLHPLQSLCLSTTPLQFCKAPGSQRPMLPTMASLPLFVPVVHGYLVWSPASQKLLTPSLLVFTQLRVLSLMRVIILTHFDILALWPSDLPIQPLFPTTAFWALDHLSCVPTLCPQLLMQPSTITQQI